MPCAHDAQLVRQHLGDLFRVRVELKSRSGIASAAEERRGRLSCTHAEKQWKCGVPQMEWINMSAKRAASQ